MKIVLSRAEVMQAVTEFLANQGINVQSDKVEVIIESNPESTSVLPKPVSQEKEAKKTVTKPKEKQEIIHTDTVEDDSEPEVEVAEVTDAPEIKETPKSLFNKKDAADSVAEPTVAEVNNTRKLFANA